MAVCKGFIMVFGGGGVLQWCVSGFCFCGVGGFVRGSLWWFCGIPGSGFLWLFMGVSGGGFVAVCGSCGAL